MVSKLGGIITPLIAGAVSWGVAKLAAFDPSLASNVDQAAIVTFVWAGIMSVVNYFTNAKQTQEVKKIQAIVNVPQDGWFGPLTYTEVRRAIPVNSGAKAVKKKPTILRRKR